MRASTTYPSGVTWTTLPVANPSLRSWERSAATAGAAGLAWWPRWAWQTPLLRREISEVIGHGAPPEAFHEALTVVRSKISEAFEAGRQAAQQAAERTRAEARRTTAQQAPPPSRRKWRAWP